MNGVTYDLCNDLDPDDDNDGFTDADESTCSSNPNSNASKPDDTDDDGACDNGVDDDDDNDGVLDVNEPVGGSLDPQVCGDLDGDTCDDCSQSANDFTPGDNFTIGQFNGIDRMFNDGPDADNDGLCDAGDFDADNDGFNEADEIRCGSSDSDVNDTPLIQAHNNDLDNECDADDDDDDNDTVIDTNDAFPFDSTESLDTDGDNIGDNADLDLDDDGVNDDVDDCDDPTDPNHEVSWNDDDNDNDGCRDNSAEDTDDDNDTVEDNTDNCQLIANLNQDNFDNDALGNACDPDIDNDGVNNNADTDAVNASVCQDSDSDGCDDCAVVNNPPDPTNDGDDANGDGICDLNSLDDDGDGFSDALEGDCGSDPLDSNSKPTDVAHDQDQDGTCDAKDNCPSIANAGQENTAGGADGDACECGDSINAASEECDEGGDTANCDNDCTLVVCGDGITNVAAGEECDDNNNDNSDACVNIGGLCKNAVCGDNFVQTGIELCDDGNQNNNDSCPDDVANGGDCQNFTCGDGFVNPGEQCDDNNNIDDDGCSNVCQLPTCGDGIVQAGEECDDNNNDNTDACVNIGGLCKNATCGDNLVQQGVEACDDGNQDNNDACLSDTANGGTCTIAACGDGVTQTGVEACDDGTQDNSDGCLDDTANGGACTLAVCGDGVVEVGVEDCDDSGESTDCNIDCSTSTCGDGITNTSSGEECDDANQDDNDACKNNCLEPVCGNGIIEPGEQCDDGGFNSNVVPDACRLNCDLPSCGDGIVDPSVNEDCDDQNTVNNDACSNACTASACGDGIIQDNEDCDDGVNNSDTTPDACRSTCVLPTCGDGVVDVSLSEFCDDGNDEDDDACLSDCTEPRCGDGIVRTDLDINGNRVEECDDGNDQLGDACSPPNAPNGECKIITDIGWRSVTGGSFRFGDLSNSSTSAPLITISDFEMARTEITVAQYEMCVDAGACGLPKQSAGCTYYMIDNETLPVNCITIGHAFQYATWANTQDPNFTVRLPSESEWEYAARSQGQDHAIAGNVASATCDSVTAFGSQCGYFQVPNVCGRSRNLIDVNNTSDTVQGLCDMSGSLDEFVADHYTVNLSLIPTNGDPVQLSRGFYYPIRSGSWASNSVLSLTTTTRVPRFRSTSTSLIGFRVVRVAN